MEFPQVLANFLGYFDSCCVPLLPNTPPGHDGSLRFWNMDSKMCVQEIGGVHRKHFDQSINNIACHSSEPLFASAGADAIAKVYI